jgi:calpain-7
MSDILEDAFTALERATAFEEKGNSVEAATKYYEGCYLLRRYYDRLVPYSAADQEQTRDLIRQKISHYEQKAAALLNKGTDTNGGPQSPFSKKAFFHEDSSVVPMPPPTASSPRHGASLNSSVSSITQKAGQADSNLSQALDFDEAGRTTEAIQRYILASELYLECIKAAEEAGPSAESVVLFLKRRLSGALDRVEQLKNPSKGKTVVRENRLSQKATGSSLSEDEIAVLKRSSLIASGLFLPWCDKDALQLSLEALKSQLPLFTDNAQLKLSESQRKSFYKYARPNEILALRQLSHRTPSMVNAITPYGIRQKCVTDCSFVASLCICAAFERRFKKRLVTSIVYPQNSQGMPIINPNGKYMVKLWLNGVARQVVVDDHLPVDRFGNLLCSHTDTSGNALEMWVPIIEKAYMKLSGGYDFPGSNSGVDLFSLTGWIPERLFFPKNKHKVRDHETPVDRAWERLHSASSYGDCLITVSSSDDITKQEAERVGIVVGHAYAVLRVLETIRGLKLLQLKNPWAHQSWKGSYSSFDPVWDDQNLCRQMGYDPVEARKRNDGVFFITWDDVLVYFKTLHLSWNPALFAHRMTRHANWPASQGPQNDMYNVGENPQICLSFSPEAVSKRASVWVLLSRHVSRQEQEGAEVTDYLTVHIFRRDGSNKRIYYPGKDCVVRGAYTNNPHVLIRYDLQGPDDKFLSLVLSQYEKANDLGYTLSCYCTESFKFSAPVKDLPFRYIIKSEWTQSSAGGSPNHDSFGMNPMFRVRVPVDAVSLQLRCGTSRSLAINVMLVDTGKRVQRLNTKPLLDSGDYRFGFVVTDACALSKGNYTIIASTFHVGQTGLFLLEIFSSADVAVEAL